MTLKKIGLVVCNLFYATRLSRSQAKWKCYMGGWWGQTPKVIIFIKERNTIPQRFLIEEFQKIFRCGCQEI